MLVTSQPFFKIKVDYFDRKFYALVSSQQSAVSSQQSAVSSQQSAVSSQQSAVSSQQ
ncbi:TPA: hypothetical protein ACS3GD_001630 [Legionella pneumophila]